MVTLTETLHAGAFIVSEASGDVRKARAFKTRRIADASRITASELQNIRELGSETELKQLQREIARRQAKIKQNFDPTFENLRMGAITGKVVDADGTSVIYDWEAELGQIIPAEIDFDLDNPAPAYSAIVLDKDRNSWADVEVYSYPLPLHDAAGAASGETDVTRQHPGRECGKVQQPHWTCSDVRFVLSQTPRI